MQHLSKVVAVAGETVAVKSVYMPTLLCTDG